MHFSITNSVDLLSAVYLKYSVLTIVCAITFQAGQDVFFVANASSVNLTPTIQDNGNNGHTESMNWKRLVVLVIIVHVYLFIGGLVFRELESHSEVQTRTGIKNVTAEFLGEYDLQYL